MRSFAGSRLKLPRTVILPQNIEERHERDIDLSRTKVRLWMLLPLGKGQRVNEGWGILKDAGGTFPASAGVKDSGGWAGCAPQSSSEPHQTSAEPSVAAVAYSGAGAEDVLHHFSVEAEPEAESRCC